MDLRKKKKNIKQVLITASLIMAAFGNSWGQLHTPFLSHQNWLNLSEELGAHQNYNSSKVAAEKHLSLSPLFLSTDPAIRSDRASFQKSLADIYIGNAEKANVDFTNPVYKERIALAKGRYYFRNGSWANAIKAYEDAGIENLNNREIVAAKFELAYSYFNNKQFAEAKKLMLSIKDIKSKYSANAYYYYGLLTYNEGDYKSALESFEKIENNKEYESVVPYYIAEVLYFDGQKKKAFQKAIASIKAPQKSYYHYELHLLAAQCLFEENNYPAAIPYFEYYYKNVDKIRKQDLFKMGFAYYQTEQFEKAIEPFKQLSVVQEEIGQNAMYLLGDCYLKTGDKQGAKNAFSICSEMNFNPQLIEPSLLLSGKLAFELGYAAEGSGQLKKIIFEYPNSTFKSEASNILSEQLVKSNSYSEAYQMLQNSTQASNELTQKVCYGYALQNIQSEHYSEAEKLLNESINNATDQSFEAAAYFWKAEIDFRNKKYTQAMDNGKMFLAKFNAKNTIISPNATPQHALMTLGYSALNAQEYPLARQFFGQASNKQNFNSFSANLAADAVLREADAAFLDKDYKTAAELYTKTIAQKGADADYALFQKSTLLGLQGKSAEQAEILLQIIGQINPTSKYKYEAHYALGDLLLDANKFEDAIAHFQKITDKTAKHLAVNALMKISFAYQEADNHEKAIESYKNVVRQYPQSDQKNGALDALKSEYIATNQPNAYVQFLKEHNLEPTDNAGLDSLYYSAAETQFANGKFQEAIGAFTKYLNNYPQGLFKTKANFYKAESFYQMKQYDSALLGYNALFAERWTDFTEPAALKASALAMAQNNYTKAEEYFGILRNNSVSTKNLQIAYKGLMQSSVKRIDITKSANYADTLLTLPEVNEELVKEAYLAKTRLAMLNKDFEQANGFVEKAASATNTENAAEAKYLKSEILFRQDKLQEAEIATNKAIQETGGIPYWNTKAYILMAAIFTQQKDYFNAKATYKSIIKNSKIESLKNEAKEQLEKVQSLEKSKSKLKEG